MSKEKEVDVCIIGSGAGGAVVAYALGSAGFSVVVLEAGRRYNPMDYHMNEKDWEKHPYPFVNPPHEKQKNLYAYSTPEKLNTAYKHLRSKSKINGFYNNTDRRFPLTCREQRVLEEPPCITRVKHIGFRRMVLNQGLYME